MYVHKNIRSLFHSNVLFLTILCVALLLQIFRYKRHFFHNIFNVLYCIVLIGPILMGRLDRYRIPRELSEIRTQPWLREGSLTCDPYHHRGPIF